MDNNLPSEIDQIEAILQIKANELCWNWQGKGASQDKLLTVRYKQIFEYLVSKYSLQELGLITGVLRDGLNIFKIEKGYICFWHHEKFKIKSDLFTLPDIKYVYQLYIMGEILPRNYTGIHYRDSYYYSDKYNWESIKPTKIEQIEYLIHLEASHLSSQYCHKDYKNTFSVTKTEILEYVKAHYTFEELGLYDHKRAYLKLKKEGDKYIIFSWDYDYEDRTGEIIGYKEECFDTEEEVYKRYVKFITGSSGTGLSFLTPEEEREEKRLAEEKEQFLIVQKRVHRNLRGALVKGILKKGLPPEKKEALMAKINSGDWEKYVAEVEKALGA